MLSTCPSCKKQIEHEDYLFEVRCECGMRFNPFYDAMKSGGVVNEISATAVATPVIPPEPALPEVEADFSESNSAFAELRDFGENLDALKGNPEPTRPTPAYESPAITGRRAAPSGEAPLMTAGDSLQGYTVVRYLAPISVWTPLDSEGSDPLRPAYDALWGRSSQAGGNAILAIKWSFSPDGTRILMSGTPVEVNKQSEATLG